MTDYSELSDDELLAEYFGTRDRKRIVMMSKEIAGRFAAAVSYKRDDNGR